MEFLINNFDALLNYLVLLVEKAGYLGIFICMFLESTLVPIPSELIMIPAGISAAYGKINLHLAILVGVLGNLSGAVFSYYLAIYFGRLVLLKIGRYFFVTEQNFVQIEKYFVDHGEVSIFLGRLIPGVRHFISLPAGIARMNLRNFYFYTFAGSTIWVILLTYLGFLIGENKDLIKEYLDLLIFACLIFGALIILIYIFLRKRIYKLRA